MIHMESFQRILDAEITSQSITEMFMQLTNAAVNLAKEHPEELKDKRALVSLNWTEEDDIPDGTLIPVLTFEMVPFDHETMQPFKEPHPEDNDGE